MWTNFALNMQFCILRRSYVDPLKTITVWYAPLESANGCRRQRERPCRLWHWVQQFVTDTSGRTASTTSHSWPSDFTHSSRNVPVSRAWRWDGVNGRLDTRNLRYCKWAFSLAGKRRPPSLDSLTHALVNNEAKSTRRPNPNQPTLCPLRWAAVSRCVRVAAEAVASRSSWTCGKLFG